MVSLTAHCLVKNEEQFIWHSIMSVIDFVDQLLVFDTGSRDKTVSILQELVKQYPGKIIFEEKGECDKVQHTKLRQEMLERTKTDWFMVLDGDEVWPKRSVEEALKILQDNTVECIMAPFYLCVGDIYHHYYKKGSIEMLGKKDFFYPRFIKLNNGVRWQGDYNEDALVNGQGEVFFNQKNSYILQFRYWHMTHLMRSSYDDADYSSGGTRRSKRKLTYFLIGKKINEPVPEVFSMRPYARLQYIQSFINFFKLLYSKIIRKNRLRF
jgi:cellulose synthase/poly-beta-1,6-N-acetylglucosamine synthase-like glycosyltransferase